jgi:hypothetical protein
VPSSKYKSVSVAPGKGLSGFSLTSPQHPGLIQYFVDGQTGVPSSSQPAEGATEDEPLPNCPNWDFQNPRLQTLVNGIATGPLSPNTISVAIRLREVTGIRPCAPINPISPKGNLSVLVLASQTLDPSRIVISSLKFGPSGIAPSSSRLVPVGGENIAPWDEHEEWERILTLIDPNWNKNTKFQNLLLVFDEASLGIQCVLDKAIILTGQTQSGENIIGGVSTRLVGCDTAHPGVRIPRKGIH